MSMLPRASSKVWKRASSPTYGTRTSSVPFVSPGLPAEFRAMVRYAKAQQPSLRDVDELRSWLDQQIQASRPAFSMALANITTASARGSHGDESPQLTTPNSYALSPVDDASSRRLARLSPRSDSSGGDGDSDHDTNHRHSGGGRTRLLSEQDLLQGTGVAEDDRRAETRGAITAHLRLGASEQELAQPRSGGFSGGNSSSSFRLSQHSSARRRIPSGNRTSSNPFSSSHFHRTSDALLLREQPPDTGLQLPLGLATVPQTQLDGLRKPSDSKPFDLSPAVTAVRPETVASGFDLMASSSNAAQPLGLRLINRLQQRKANTDEFANSTNVPPSLGSKDLLIHSPRNGASGDYALSTLDVKRHIESRDYFWTPTQIATQRFYKISQVLRCGMNLLVLLMIFFSAFSIAARVGLTSDHVPPQLCWVELGLDTLCFVVVLAVNLLVPYEDGGHVVFDATAIARRYASDPWLAGFDVVSNFPALVVLAPLGLSGFEFARVNLLLREMKLGRVLDTLEELLVPPTVHPSLVRLFNYFLYLVLIVTHLSMVFMLVLRSESEHSVEAWMEMSHESLEHDPVYWFLRCWREMLTAIAEKRLQYPHEDVEYIAGLVLLVFALATIAVILASFEEIIVSEIDSGNQLAAKIESTIAALEHRGLPDAFQEEVAEYYERMWEINRTFDFEVAEDVLAELPHGLHADIEFECNARIIRNIPLFEEVASNPRFIRLLVGQLRQIVVMPGAAIVQKGEDGDCMFFLSSGDAAVMNEAGDEELVTLGVGAFFGEVTMLFGGTRDRDILAKTVCVCAVITAEQFEQILQEYPEALEGILNVAVARAHDKIARLMGADAMPVLHGADDGDSLAAVAEQSMPSPQIQVDPAFDDPFANTGVGGSAAAALQQGASSDFATNDRNGTSMNPSLGSKHYTPIDNSSFFEDGNVRTQSIAFREAFVQRLRAGEARRRSNDRSQEVVSSDLLLSTVRPAGESATAMALNLQGLLEETFMTGAVSAGRASSLTPSRAPRNRFAVASGFATQ